MYKKIKYKCLRQQLLSEKECHDINAKDQNTATGVVICRLNNFFTKTARKIQNNKFGLNRILLVAKTK